MYKAFKKESMSKSNSKAMDKTAEKPDGASEEVKMKVAKCWQAIEEQCQSNLAVKMPPEGSTEAIWKPVRLFVSSTFSDFFNEREALVKKVFPALREWCEDRRLLLIECDLRWGVPKDTPTGDTICTCLEEIDRCYHDNQHQPFFLCMMGERYGWIPADTDIPQDVKDRYDWVSDTSITSMEILHGAYRCKSRNAAFFIRDPEIVSDLPDNHVNFFVDKDPLQVEQLQVLKKKIHSRFPDQVFNYKCHVTSVDDSSGQERVNLGGLDDFCEQVLQFFKLAIERMYPKATVEVELSYTEASMNLMRPIQNERISPSLLVFIHSLIHPERQTHHAFIEHKADGIVGRNDDIDKIIKFASQGSVDPCFQEMAGFPEGKKKEYLSNWQVTEADNPILCLVAPSGYGKSSLLACAVLSAIQNGLDVFYHFADCEGRSNVPEECVYRLICHLVGNNEGKADTDKLRFVAEQYLRPELIKLLNDSLDNKSRKPTFIVIDGLDKMIDSDKIYSTAWLPCRFPSNIRCVVSTSEHSLILDRLGLRGALRWDLNPISMETRKLIAEHYLGRFSKKLDSEQMSHLLSHNGSVLPQWLTLACEELRIFGNFRGVTRMTETFPESLDGLVSIILSRKIKEDETNYLEKLLCLIHASMAGLSEEDVPVLLGNRNEPVPMMTWAALRRAIKPFIQTTAGGALSVSSRISFSSSVVNQVINKDLIKAGEAVKWHRHLADHFQYNCRRISDCVDELPHQLLKASCNKRLIDFLRQDGRSLRINEFFKRKYVQRITCQKPASMMPNSKPPILCKLCNNKTGMYKKGFNPSETCLHCGLWIPANSQMKKPAQTCVAHTIIRGPPGAEICFECGTQVTKFNGPSYQVSLCTWCWKMNSCSVILTK